MVQKQKRHATRRDRKVWRRNALLGTKKWVEESERRRERQRARERYGWGFQGKSPRTRPRRHKR